MRSVLTVSLLCACSLLARQPATFNASTGAGAATASNAFGIDLYRQVPIDDKNLIYSPASASIALTMATTGARGETQAEMARVLHLEAARLSDSHASFGSLLANVNGRDGKAGGVLHVADRIWGQQGYTGKKDFAGLMDEHYRAPWEPVDFHGAPDGRPVRRSTAARTGDARPDSRAHPAGRDRHDDRPGADERGVLQRLVGRAVRAAPDP